MECGILDYEGPVNLNLSAYFTSLAHDSLHAANLAVLQSNFDASWVSGGIGKYVLDNTARQFPCRLILLQYNVNF